MSATTKPRSTERLVAELDEALNSASAKHRAELCYEKARAVFDIAKTLRTNGEFTVAAEMFDAAAVTFQRSWSLYNRAGGLGSAAASALEMCHSASGHSERTHKRAAQAGLNWRGLYAAKGRDGYWFTSWAHDGQGRQSPCDADDQFLLSRVSEAHAYDVLHDQWLAGEID